MHVRLHRKIVEEWWQATIELLQELSSNIRHTVDPDSPVTVQ